MICMLGFGMIMARNMRAGPTWIPGEVIQKLGPVTYLVDVYGDRPWKCHIDQLKERVDNSNSTNRVPGPSQLADEGSPNSEFDVAPTQVPEQLPDIPGEVPPPRPVEEPRHSTSQEERPSGRDLPTESTGPDTGGRAAESNPTPTQPTESAEPATQQRHNYPLRDRARHRRK